MTKTSKNFQDSVVVPSLRIALIFFVVSSLWIFLSDRIWGWLSIESTHKVLWKLVEGWLFVLFLGTVVFFLVRNILRSKYELNVSLSLSQSRYRTITEKTLTGILIIDDEGFIEYVNPAFCRIFNYRPSEILKQHFNLIIPPQEQEERMKLHHHFFQDAPEANGFYNVLNKEGESLVVYVDAVRIENEEGQWQQLLFMNDVSGQRRAESKLAESEQRYRVMMESLHEPVIITDHNAYIVYANQAFIEQFGPPPANVPCHQAVFGKGVDCSFMQHMGSSLARKFELQIEDEQRGRVFRVTHVPLEDYGHGFLGMTIFQDLTEILQAQNKAEQSDRLKSSFLANMSHEIRTPLNAILGFSGLLLDEQITKEERQSFVALVNQSGNQLLKVIDDIIDYSFIESGNLELHPNQVLAKELVDDLLEFAVKHKQLYKKSEVEVLSAVNLPDQFVFKGDSKRLKQVLTNLLDNALKFTDHGSVSLSVSLSSNDLIFMVSDTGIGISKEMQKVVFERFRQEDEALSRNFGGSGLGLSISQNLVKLMGGKMEMISHVGRGTHLKVHLPIAN